MRQNNIIPKNLSKIFNGLIVRERVEFNYSTAPLAACGGFPGYYLVRLKKYKDQRTNKAPFLDQANQTILVASLSLPGYSPILF